MQLSVMQNQISFKTSTFRSKKLYYINWILTETSEEYRSLCYRYYVDLGGRLKMNLLVTAIGVDTAENGPFLVWGRLRFPKYLLLWFKENLWWRKPCSVCGVASLSSLNHPPPARPRWAPMNLRASRQISLRRWIRIEQVSSKFNHANRFQTLLRRAARTVTLSSWYDE